MTMMAELRSASKVTLADKWDQAEGRVMLSGTQAIPRILLSQRAADAAAGLHTAGYISGYRGSPLGGVDMALWSVADRLTQADVRFVAGVNEDLAATAVRGTQQLDFVPGAQFDGVFAAWYGKGPGVDRSIDALKHGNYAGAHPRGGVALFYGDDHGGKSSTVAHHSEQAMASALIPSLYPANVAEVIRYGLLAFAMSRFSGSWVGIKLVNEVAEQTATVDLSTIVGAVVLPEAPSGPVEGRHVTRAYLPPARAEQIVEDYRLPLVRAFVRANGIDRVDIDAPRRKLGIVTAGKSFGDTRHALELLGLPAERAAELGLSIYKVGCIWPLETAGLREFAQGHDTLMFVEEKTAFLEPQAAHALINDTVRPRFVGKLGHDGQPLFSTTQQLDPVSVALAIAGELERLGIDDAACCAKAEQLRQWVSPVKSDPTQLRRAPYFCSGCPHNRSTRVPDGSLSMTGIGCHTMAALARPTEALLPTHMGAEGLNWTGLAPFTSTRHIFQNMGDGTYYHSGLLAIRAAVASGANITYKILYNDAVAMTGGQPVDGPISVLEIAQQVRHEGVGTIVILSDNPEVHRGDEDLPAGVRIGHRDELDAIQRELRNLPGCSVLIYEQVCAAEKRRRRKRGLYPNPTKRLHIATAVCEACGDCSAQSTCVSIQPQQTGLGTKRRIDQSSCNKDYSCNNGFCPSFITVHNPAPKKSSVTVLPPLPDLDAAPVASLADGSYNILVAGIGGTGVVTVGAIIGMAAHIDGNVASVFDMTGLAQKNGAVFSHVRIGSSQDALHAQRVSRGAADLMLALDLVASLDPEAAATLDPSRTRAVVNTAVTPTVAFQFDGAAVPGASAMLKRLNKLTADSTPADGTRIAMALTGDSVGLNLFMVGVAVEQGLLPVSDEAIEAAVRLNATAVELNIRAFRLGRLLVAAPHWIEAVLPAHGTETDASKEDDLDTIIKRRARHVAAYQDAALAARYRALVEKVRAAEAAFTGSRSITRAVAVNYANVLTYKDEYEVARLLSDPALIAELRAEFGETASFSYNLAPPIMNGYLVNGRPRKRTFQLSRFRPLLRLLSRLKCIRGTMLDPFGYTAERRSERLLIREYEDLVDTILANLEPDRLAEAAAAVSHIASVRGFGPVKDASLETYRRTIPGKLDALKAQPLSQAA